jgi:TfoX/Sxy family transcriptional regulator of competence genes
MAYDERLAERLRALFAGRRDVEEKRMFGGICLMVAGNMCCGVSRDRLLVRVGAEHRDAALGEPHTTPMIMRNRPVAAFLFVEAAGVKADAGLKKWVRRATDFVATLPPKVPGVKR